MKDRPFSGQDVEEAIAVAAASMGLPRADLRFVVLDPGTPGGRGLKPTPARIAVLVGQPEGRLGQAPRGGAPETRDEPLGALRATMRAITSAADLELDVDIEESEEAIIVHLRGADTAFFLGADGRGEVLRATEHLLHRLYGFALRPRAMRLTGEGFRERRDQALAEEARRLADAVRADGTPRTMEPLNSYERRIVHVALQEEAGVTTYSLGEGSARRVTVAPAPVPGGEPGDAEK